MKWNGSASSGRASSQQDSQGGIFPPVVSSQGARFYKADDNIDGSTRVHTERLVSVLLRPDVQVPAGVTLCKMCAFMVMYKGLW